MADHECIVGLYCEIEDAELVTITELKERIVETREFNKGCDLYNVPDMKYKEWTLRDYADKRKSTNLTRFDFCPECGKAINWAAIRMGTE